MSVSTLYRDPGNGSRKAAELHRRIWCELHHSPYNNKEAPGEECDFKVLLKREKGGLRRYGRWHLGDREEGTTIRATLFPPGYKSFAMRACRGSRAGSWKRHSASLKWRDPGSTKH